MNIYVQLLITLLSGMIATIVTLIVTEVLRKRHAKYDYKLSVFRTVIACRTDIASGSIVFTGQFQIAINEVFIAYNDCPDVLKAFEEFRKTVQYKINPNIENDKVIESLLSLFKAMAKELKIDYNFSNDELFTHPILMGNPQIKNH